MAQFDVYNNPSKKTRKAYPYLVDIQIAILDQMDTRLVVPLTPIVTQPNMLMARLTPEVEIDGEKYLFLTPQLASMPEAVLQNPIGTLVNARTKLIDAIDFAITGI